MKRWLIWATVGLIGLSVSVNISPSWSQSREKATEDGPSLEDTFAFIKDTFLGCGGFLAQETIGQYTDKNGNPITGPIHHESFAESILLQSPYHVRLEIRSRWRLSHMGEGRKSKIAANPILYSFEFNLNELNPGSAVAAFDSNLKIWVVGFKCSRGACITIDFTHLDSAYKPFKLEEALDINKELLLREIRVGWLESLKGLVKSKYQEQIKQNELAISVCNEDSAQSLAKAFTHAISKAGGKKPLF
ncbi:MAG: hypothetical protein WBK08_18115 [Nitrospira sp.]|nr:MAG: hypothetical protein E8D42_13200 [Nitrospira sp.]